MTTATATKERETKNYGVYKVTLGGLAQKIYLDKSLPETVKITIE